MAQHRSVPVLVVWAAVLAMAGGCDGLGGVTGTPAASPSPSPSAGAAPSGAPDSTPQATPSPAPRAVRVEILDESGAAIEGLTLGAPGSAGDGGPPNAADLRARVHFDDGTSGADVEWATSTNPARDQFEEEVFTLSADGLVTAMIAGHGSLIARSRDGHAEKAIPVTVVGGEATPGPTPTPGTPGILAAGYLLPPTCDQIPADLDRRPPDRQAYVYAIDYPFGPWGPHPGLGADFTGFYAVRHLAGLRFDAAGTTSLRVASDDGARLYLDGRLIVDNDGCHGAQSATGSFDPGSPGVVALVLDYFQGRFEAGLALYWTPPGQAEERVPPAAFQGGPAPTPLPAWDRVRIDQTGPITLQAPGGTDPELATQSTLTGAVVWTDGHESAPFWRSEDSDVITIDASGVVQAVGPGTGFVAAAPPPGSSLRQPFAHVEFVVTAGDGAPAE